MKYLLQYSLLLVSALVFTLAPGPAQADLLTKPTKITIDLSSQRPSGTIKVTNTTSLKKRYRITTHHFNLLNNKLQLIEPDDKSLAQWIKFSPREFSLNPGSSRQIRYTIIKPRRPLSEGLYWGALAFQPLEGRKVTYQADNKSTVEYEVIPRMFVPIFGEYGKQIRTLNLEVATQAFPLKERKGVFLLGKVMNSGNSHTKMKAEFIINHPISGKLIYSGRLPNVTLFPENSMQLAISLPQELPKGSYIVNIKIDSNSGEALTRQLNLTYQ